MSTPILVAHDARIGEPLHLQRPALGRRLASVFSRRPVQEQLRVGGDLVARIERPGGGERGTLLRFGGRRYRLDRPPDATLGEGLQNFLVGFFGMPRRRDVWRVGTGIATEIRETSVSRKELSGVYQVDGRSYQVVRSAEGLLQRRYDGRIHGDGGVIATLDPATVPATGMRLSPVRPTRLDVLVLGLYMMIWLEGSVGGGPGGAGGGGPGGGGGC